MTPRTPVAHVLALMLVLTPASAAQLNNDDLKNLDGTWQGELRTSRRGVSKGASLELTGEAQEVRLEIRRTPTDMRIRNANGQWAPINATKGDFFSLFKYQTAPGNSLAALSGPVTTKTVFGLNIKRCTLRRQARDRGSLSARRPPRCARPSRPRRLRQDRCRGGVKATPTNL